MMRPILALMLLALLLMSAIAQAQEPTGESGTTRPCNHGGYELWGTLRMLPVRFTGFDGEIAMWKYQDEYTVKVGSFVLHRHGHYISREKKVVSVLYVRQRMDADWLCYYCSHCQTLLRAYELKPDSHFD